MKTAKDVLEYLKFEGLNLHSIIGENESEFNKGRIYAMDRIINSLEELILIEEENYIIETALKEVEMIKNGKLPKKSAREFVNETQ